MTKQFSGDVRVAVAVVHERQKRRIQRAKQAVAFLGILTIAATAGALLVSNNGRPDALSFMQAFREVWRVFGLMALVLAAFALTGTLITFLIWWAWPNSRPTRSPNELD
jgi:hypothetical protein